MRSYPHSKLTVIRMSRSDVFLDLGTAGAINLTASAGVSLNAVDRQSSVAYKTSDRCLLSLRDICA